MCFGCRVNLWGMQMPFFTEILLWFEYINLTNYYCGKRKQKFVQWWFAIYAMCMLFK